ncbi:MAG: PEPxxWA-CTERM sorting domain-containing protein [Phenylobacterium sp.]
MKTLLAITLAAGSIAAGAAQATIYTHDANLADFTNGVTDYATFSNFKNGNAPDPSDPGSHNNTDYQPGFTYTPTTASLNHDYRIFNWTGGAPAGLQGIAPSENWVLATFSDAESSIRVFSNIDHYGDSYDGYQYQIWGYDGSNTWTELYDTLNVSNAGEPFTLVSYVGTAPTRVNNVLTPGTFNDAGDGTVGYISDFHFNSGYSVYAFGTSTFAGPQNPEQEFSAVAAIPEPASWALMILGLGGAGAALRRRRQALAA